MRPDTGKKSTIHGVRHNMCLDAPALQSFSKGVSIIWRNAMTVSLHVLTPLWKWWVLDRTYRQFSELFQELPKDLLPGKEHRSQYQFAVLPLHQESTKSPFQVGEIQPTIGKSPNLQGNYMVAHTALMCCQPDSVVNICQNNKIKNALHETQIG